MSRLTWNYRRIKVEGRGNIYEHRLVMEQKLGRPLQPNELVHHINGDGKDNRPENLALTTKKGHSEIHPIWNKGTGDPEKTSSEYIKNYYANYRLLHRDSINASNRKYKLKIRQLKKNADGVNLR